MKLVASDVDRIDALCPMLEQDLGKSARRGADVETDMRFWFKAEMLELSRKFMPPRET